jgi:N6-adenosine-specific RNA methylase IME4
MTAPHRCRVVEDYAEACMLDSKKPARLILADPPWKFADQLPGDNRGAAKNYRCMSVAEITFYGASLRVPVADGCLLLLWRLSALQEEALQVARGWGFVPKSEIVWDKVTKNGKPHFGMGHYVRASHESCLLCVRGKVHVDDRSVRSRFTAPVGKHSEKPDEIYAIAERLVAGGPWLELFARRRRAHWLQLGDELPRPSGRARAAAPERPHEVPAVITAKERS